MMLRRGDRGEEVRGLQRDLTTAGFPAGPIDGVFGAATHAAVTAFQEAEGLVPDGVVGPRTSAALRAFLEAGAGGLHDDGDDVGHGEDDLDGELEPDADALPEVPTTFPDFFDNSDGELAHRYRDEIYRHEASGRWLDWPGRPGQVDIAQRTHVCLHITAVHFGTSPRRRAAWAERIRGAELSPQTLDRYGADDVEAAATRMALHERFWKVAYHWVGLRNGDILFNNDPTRYTYHGNRSNRFAIGVAAEAVLPGRESGRTAEHTVVDDHFVDTNRQTLRLAITTARERGAPLEHVTAHRCFSMTRAGDPGEAYWKEVVLPVCEELDVAVDYGLVVGGRPIPREWDPSARFGWDGTELV